MDVVTFARVQMLVSDHAKSDMHSKAMEYEMVERANISGEKYVKK